MTRRSYNLYAKDILDSIEKIEEFICGMDFEAFNKDDKTSSAVIRKLEIIGEAVKQLPTQIRGNYKGIPWKEMAGMRDKLIHWYFGVDHEVVWNVITEEIPQLKNQLKEILDKIKTLDSDLSEKNTETNQHTANDISNSESKEIETESKTEE